MILRARLEVCFVTFLGHIVSEQGIATDPRKTEAVRSWQVPKNLRQLRRFLGLCSYYQRFIKDFSTVAKPLHRLTEKKVKFVWDSVCQESFSQIKRALVNTTTLAYPDPNGQFILDTVASGVGLGVVLSQVQHGRVRVLGYYSRSLTRSALAVERDVKPQL